MSKPVGPNRGPSLPAVGLLYQSHATAASAAHRLHDPALVALPVSILVGRALVVLLLALGEPHEQLGTARLPVKLQGHERVAAPLNRADQVIELAPVQQKFA